MNAIAPHSPTRPYRFTPETERLMRAQADRWAIIRIAARCIPADVDLDDECAVALALLAHSFMGRQIADILSDVIELARELRGEGRAWR